MTYQKKKTSIFKYLSMVLVDGLVNGTLNTCVYVCTWAHLSSF